MLLKYLILAAALTSISAVYAQVYYVAVGGSLTLSTTESSPGDIEFAFSNAPANSIVHVKQGDYGALNLVISNDSVNFIGYTSVPGDISASDIPDYDSFDSLALASIFPLIDGANQAAGGTGIYSPGNKNVTLKNFFIRNFLAGLTFTGTNNRIENCIATNFGDKFNSYSGTGYNFYGDYNTLENCFLLNAGAQGMTSKGNDCLIQNCQVYSDDTTAFAPTDYYILVTANTSTSEGRYNVVNQCKVERIGDLAHPGHGLCLTTFYTHELCASGGGYCYNPIYADDSVVGNLIQNSTSINIGEPILLRGPGVQKNDIVNVTSESYGGLTLTSGASFNTFTNCHIKDTYYYDIPSSSSISFNAAVEFFANGWANTDDMNVAYSGIGTYPWSTIICAEGNVFRNCLFENVSAGIMHSSYSEFYDDLGNPVDRINRKIVKDNKFVNCTFVGRDDSVDVLFYAMRGSEGNEMINCVIHGFANWESRYFPTSMSTAVLESHNIIPSNYKYNHCNFYNNGFDTSVVSIGTLAGPIATVLIGFNDSLSGEFINCNLDDPGFVNSSAGDYRIQDCATCGTKDRGLNESDMIALGYGDLTFDLDNLFRPCQNIYDIGAFEFQDCAILSEMEHALSGITIYPNPSHGTIFIQGNGIQEVTIFNSVGIKVDSKRLNADQTEIELPEKKGIYFLIIRDSSEVLITKKVIKT